MNSPRLTLDQFRATGRDVADLNAEPDIYLGDEVRPGRVYEGGLCIETGASAKWCLTVGNDSRESDDLAALELDLYDFGVGEGYFEEVRG
jgi:hypothetical protein